MPKHQDHTAYPQSILSEAHPSQCVNEALIPSFRYLLFALHKAAGNVA